MISKDISANRDNYFTKSFASKGNENSHSMRRSLSAKQSKGALSEIEMPILFREHFISPVYTVAVQTIG